jgi:hypothetical protein
MKILTTLLAAIAAIFVIAPAAHAQSVQDVQLKRMDTGLAASVLPDGTIGFALDNNSDFKQRFSKEKVTGNIVRLSRAGVNSCIRDVGIGNAKLGNCSGQQAQWSEFSYAGGKLYQNVLSHRFLVPSFCFGLCAEKMVVAAQDDLDPWGGLSIARWKLDLF